MSQRSCIRRWESSDSCVQTETQPGTLKLKPRGRVDEVSNTWKNTHISGWRRGGHVEDEDVHLEHELAAGVDVNRNTAACERPASCCWMFPHVPVVVSESDPGQSPAAAASQEKPQLQKMSETKLSRLFSGVHV